MQSGSLRSKQIYALVHKFPYFSLLSGSKARSTLKSGESAAHYTATFYEESRSDAFCLRKRATREGETPASFANTPLETRPSRCS